jgi:hypothetical protein
MEGPQSHGRSTAADRPGVYATLVSIDVRHDYCHAAAGVFGGIAVSPSPETAARLARWGLLARSRPDGIDILCTAGGVASLSEFLPTLPVPLPPAVQDELFGAPLLFVLELRDLQFFNFTASPTDVRSGEPLLSLSNDRIEIGDGVASFQIAWPDPDLGSNGAPPQNGPPSPRRSAGPLGASPRDTLSGMLGCPVNGWWLESRGQIADGVEERDKLAKQRQPRPFGLIEIYVAPPAEEAAPAGGWNGYPVNLSPADGQSYVTPCRYRLGFPARPTRWRYVVAGRDGKPLPATLSIVDPHDPDGAPFEPAQPRTLPDGQSAACFAAKDAIELRQHPAARFSLHGTLADRRPRTLIDPLPAASADAIIPDPTLQPDGSPSPAWSDIYVFV